jgi:hypothetical protein
MQPLTRRSQPLTRRSTLLAVRLFRDYKLVACPLIAFVCQRAEGFRFEGYVDANDLQFAPVEFIDD